MTDIEAQPTLTAAVASLQLAGELLNIVAKGAIEDLAWDEALELLSDIRATLDDHIRPIEASLVRHVYLKGPHGNVEVEGIGMVNVHRSTNRKHWDERSALFAVLDARLQERGGEVPDPAEVVEWVLEVAGINYLRVGALKAVGLRADDYCDTSPGTPQVAITRPSR